MSLSTDEEVALALGHLRARRDLKQLVWAQRKSKNPMMFEATRLGLDIWVYRINGTGANAGKWRCKYGAAYGGFYSTLEECCWALSELFYLEWRRCGDPECIGLCSLPECVPPKGLRASFPNLVVATPGKYLVPPKLWREHCFIAVAVWCVLRLRALRRQCQLTVTATYGGQGHGHVQGG